MTTQINDEIEVLVHFHHGQLKPFRFLWKNRPHAIDSITSLYQTRDGGNIFLHFAALSESNLYELVYSLSDHFWKLTQVQTS